MFNSRTLARKCALQTFYCCYFNNDSKKRVKLYFLKNNNNRIDKAYYNVLITNIPKKIRILDEFLLSMVAGKLHLKIDNVLDLFLLRMITFELLYLKKVPKNTVFFETLQLANKYSTTTSCSFIKTIFKNKF